MYFSFKVNLTMGYIITGPVESVIYTRNDYWVCYVSMTNNDANGDHQYVWHKSNSNAMCEFAERCRLLEISVKMHGIPDDGNNILEALEYANTNARW